ncbi:rod shape-determining protein MreC [Chromobacterium subtsugae]|uniref:Cell shape-determining protein MreC n=1 Tax=Chromobacterium subtsugae TaxID=251747 RepID=A0ABS7F8M1_9NEIS|nr:MULTISPECIES: rod shape-determining protein MreC [Chromobacterium]KUM02455.1 rod shape-determining protein MreC [Chromobacterium subtsugae]KZE86677.1 rod shape-determining protein MreC [Chromobacterium sp. F49]MBW7565126.1 rod shape-determining protein MreC [Chromobacterium subtsugae]MBW8286346.1 rod shape-determining protein MreC [Chromobacterium subtsugae]OBU87791.1 rod shape-determining protein MreC [Chromobacterium subtsugae]
MDFANTPSFFRSGPPPAARLAMSAVASIALLIGDSHYGLMEQAREALSLALYPVQRAVNLPAQAVRHAGDYLTSQTELKQENTELRTRQLQMSAQLSRLQTLERELNELRALNAIRAQRDDSAQIAETLYTGRDPFSYKIIIDKGDDAKLQAGQPVVDPRGLLGQVTRVQPLTAEVTLVIDKNQMVPVMIARTGERAILYGYGGGVELRYLPQSSDVKENDQVVTSGLDGLFPEGIPVAVVSKVERNPGAAFTRVSTVPLAGVQQTRYVLVLQARETRARPAEAPAIVEKKTRGGRKAAAEE